VHFNGLPSGFVLRGAGLDSNRAARRPVSVGRPLLLRQAEPPPLLLVQPNSSNGVPSCRLALGPAGLIEVDLSLSRSRVDPAQCAPSGPGSGSGGPSGHCALGVSLEASLGPVRCSCLVRQFRWRRLEKLSEWRNCWDASPCRPCRAHRRKAVVPPGPILSAAWPEWIAGLDIARSAVSRPAGWFAPPRAPAGPADGPKGRKPHRSGAAAPRDGAGTWPELARHRR